MSAPDVSPLAGVDWDAVTGRPPFQVETAAVRRRIAGRRVLVTGAAGSLGRPLSEALAGAAPARLVLFDQHESSLFRLRQALTAARPDLDLRAVLGDVRAARRVHRVFEAHAPEVVFHLAAYKQVPWGEEDPEAFADVNVLGAQTVIDASRAAGVAQIVYPSTDKAIDPPSLYGATKRLVEAMLQAAALAGGPRCAIVRFVNVLGSQGSAPETFARLLRAGAPLTITDPAMRRYWITPAHACLLLLHAACLDERVIVVAPDAGEEIPILEIARRLAALLGSPGEAPSIAITGPRPGERLAEPLAAPYERLEPVSLPGLLAVRGGSPVAPPTVDTLVARVAALLASDAAPQEVRAALFDAARTLQLADRPAVGRTS